MSENQSPAEEPDFDAFELELAQVKLPELKVDRDQLMYRAGFEAALKQVGAIGDEVDAFGMATPNVPDAPAFDDGQSNARWKLATLVLGGLAAMLAVILFVQLDSLPTDRAASTGYQGTSDRPVASDDDQTPVSNADSQDEALAASESNGAIRSQRLLFNFSRFLFGPRNQVAFEPLVGERGPNTNVSSAMLRNQLAYRFDLSNYRSTDVVMAPADNFKSNTNYQLMRELVDLTEKP